MKISKALILIYVLFERYAKMSSRILRLQQGARAVGCLSNRLYICWVVL